MHRPLELLPPRPRRPTWWALLVAIAVHAAVLSLRGADWFRQTWSLPEVQLVELPTELITPLVLEPPPPPRVPERERPAEESISRAQIARPTDLVTTDVAGFPTAPVDSAAGVPSPAGTGRATVPLLRPSLGDGILWVQPLPLAPRELAERLTRTHYELVDSAVSVIVQRYIDSLLAAPTPLTNRPPSWTTQIGGKTFGIDSRSIHLGGLKIPTAILALLPIADGGGNIDLRYANRLADIQSDLQYAAQRAVSMDEFKRAIREIRERREREEAFERNRERPPADTSKVP